MSESSISKKPAVRPPHKRAPGQPLHLQISRPIDDPRASAAESAPAVYPLRLPPRARSYSKSDLATAAEMFMKLKHGDDLRLEKVTDIRTALLAEDYENAVKIEVAVQKILTELQSAGMA